MRCSIFSALSYFLSLGSIHKFLRIQCAPMIAMGLNTIGCSAYGITALSMAALFGGVGTGLAGYKMNTRTKSLTYFQFKEYSEKVRYLKEKSILLLFKL